MRMCYTERDTAAARLSIECEPLQVFFCSLHPLGQFIEVANKELKKHDKEK